MVTKTATVTLNPTATTAAVTTTTAVPATSTTTAKANTAVSSITAILAYPPNWPSTHPIHVLIHMKLHSPDKGEEAAESREEKANTSLATGEQTHKPATGEQK